MARGAARRQPVGDEVAWAAVASPVRGSLSGKHVTLRPIEPATDARSLFAISHAPDGDTSIWTYLPDGPYANAEGHGRTLKWAAGSEDPLYFAIEPLDAARALGQAAYMRIDPRNGSIEIGHIWFGPSLQRTAAATEAIFLLARHVFDDLGYRRLEWKCNALNAPSRAAAKRFGFTFEGVFRNHQVVKGRNRDTAWFSIIDDEWPAIRGGFEAWLEPANFGVDGCQKRPLSELIAAVRG